MYSGFLVWEGRRTTKRLSPKDADKQLEDRRGKESKRLTLFLETKTLLFRCPVSLVSLRASRPVGRSP